MSTVQKTGRVALCKHLRSKEMYHSDTPMEEDLYHSGIYWCQHTTTGIGPDGSCVDSEECSAERGCFEK